MVSTDIAPPRASQFFEGLYWPLADAEALSSTIQPVPDTVQLAADTLLSLMVTLCAADSGWPADQPQTADTLLPYVADEAEELLEALQQWAPASAQPLIALPQTPQRLAELSAFLLWTIAASSPEAMKLLEGVPTDGGQRWETAGVRLVPILKIQRDHASDELDLAAQTLVAADQALDTDALLPLPELASPALPVGQWQDRIWQQAITLVPALAQWRSGLPVQLLLPGSEWGEAKLFLALQIVAVPPRALPTPHRPAVSTPPPLVETLFDPVGTPEMRVWPATEAAIAPLKPAALVPDHSLEEDAQACDITFTDITPLQTAIFVATISRGSHRVGQASAQLSALDLVRQVHRVISPTAVTDLTAGGTPTLALLVPQTMATLCEQVKWLWIQASQDFTPLMEGLSARRLRSGQAWTTGRVAIAGHLSLRSAADSPIVLDVTTGEWPLPELPLEAHDILHLKTATALPQELWLAADLTTHITTWVRQRSPLLACLLDGQSITLSSPQDALFPEAESAPRQLCFQILLHWLP
ncbi:MAG: hypothetical protein AAF728_06835 [Cyanobacteria bacterium P01_D01_bin.128]